ncbi:DUF4127 family protein [Catellatospora sp. NPDC049111]|uniref:DUF4127 family protein n=1 Tax=Catellatospora sp. NPDC049111 TaxID=3155271 RepID=UPI0033C1540B
MITIALVPLDDRPACRKLPHLVAAVAGARVLTPPRPVLPEKKTPGHPDAISRWLRGTTANAAVVCLETLGHGGLIASRLSDEPVTDVLERWKVLAGLAHPVHAATVVQRTPDADDDGEEPAYWATHGRALHRYSAGLHRALRDRVAPPDPGTVPAVARRDFLRRRHRNHLLNQHALQLAADGVLRTLVIGADDSSADAVGTAEWQWLRAWSGWLEPAGAVLTHPGADETATVLTARALAHATGLTPAVSVTCADPAGLQRIAPYEAVPVGAGAASQLAAAGARVVADASAVLVVHAPQPGGVDWAVNPPQHLDTAAAAATAALVERLLADGRTVALADCAAPNGADPALLAELTGRGLLARLAGYAGWNTAGNSIGTAAAHLVAYLTGSAAGTLDRRAHARLLAHRVAEDHAYMSHARAVIRAELGADPTRHDEVAPGSGVESRIEDLVTARWRELNPMPGWRIRPGSIALPWRRTFEIDIDVEQEQ